MKKIVTCIFTAMALLSAQSINSLDSDETSSYEESSSTSTTVKSNSQKTSKTKNESSIALRISMGHRNLVTDANSFSFTYTDESPSPDAMTISDVKINGGGSGFALGAAIESDSRKRHHLEGFAEYQFGAISLFYAGIGAGYNQNIGEKLCIRPKVQAGYARSILDVGELHNESVYIQINETQFYDDKLDVKAKAHNLATTPQLEVFYRLNKKMHISLTGGYQFVKSLGKPYVEFESTENSDSNDDGSNDAESETENLDESNLYFTIDGKEVNKLPFSASGMSLNLSVGFYL